MDEARKERIRELLEAGRLRREIAEEVGVSPSTITRWARILGFADVAPRPSPTDWRSVQAHYDAGHTIDECVQRFGFTYGAWDKAVTRGDLQPRPRSWRQLAHETRDRVEDLLGRGLTQAQIARELCLTKSTVAYHARMLGIRADPRFARRHDWAAVQEAIDEQGLSMRQCMVRFGFSRDTWYRAVRRGDVVPRPHVLSLTELLVVGRRTQRGHLKARLLREGLKENRCEECGLSEWRGQSLSLQLHHVNGDGLDNRLENLQLLCANCHSLTPTWGGAQRASAQATGGERPPGGMTPPKRSSSA
jgi:HNH endonuclease